MRANCLKIGWAMLVLSGACAGGAAAADAPAAAVDVGSITSVNTGNTISHGWRFYADEDITVTHLGVFDYEGDGLANEHEVRLWHLPLAGGFVDLTPVVTVGPAGVVEDNHVYVELTDSAELIAGERYLLGRWDPSVNTDVLLFDPSSAADFSSAPIHLDPAGGYTRDTEGTAGIVEPWGVGDLTTHIGVNFKFYTTEKVSLLILDLVDAVETVNVQQGIVNSLDAKLDAALNALDDLNQNNDVAAINALNAFISATQAQSGNKISVADADALIAQAQAIVEELGG